ncbi:MAG: hypothetical protein ACOWWH_12570 [Eubacteriaceae bacterium]
MAYNRKEKYEEALKIINEQSLYFISDVIAYLGIAPSTFYEWWPDNSDESNNIKTLLDTNKVNAKVDMRKKWKDSDNPTLQVALMKLISTDEEAHRLNGTKQEHKLSGEVNIKPKEWIK